MAGRPRLPTAIKVLKGTAQPCRMNPNEPQLPTADHLPCPSHLPETHRTWWDYLAKHAAKLRCLTEADVPALEEMAGVKAEIARAEAEGEPTADLRKMLFNMLGRFGMTPSDRSKVSGAPQESKSPLAKFKVYPGKG